METHNNLVQNIVNGRLWRSDNRHLLVLGEGDVTLAGKVLASGSMVLRYAIPMHGPRHLSVIPAIFVSEQGGVLYGHQAWRFMMKNYQLYPRAEIVGLQSDGDEVQVYLKELDFGDARRVLVYESVTRTLPLAQLDHILTPKPSLVPALAADIVTVEYKES